LGKKGCGVCLNVSQAKETGLYKGIISRKLPDNVCTSISQDLRCLTTEAFKEVCKEVLPSVWRGGLQ